MADHDYVRVLDEDTGHKLTIRRRQLPHGNFTELDEPATDVFGAVLAAEHGTPPPAAEDQPSPASQTAEGDAPTPVTSAGVASQPDTGEAPSPAAATDAGQTGESDAPAPVAPLADASPTTPPTDPAPADGDTTPTAAPARRTQTQKEKARG